MWNRLGFLHTLYSRLSVIRSTARWHRQFSMCSSGSSFPLSSLRNKTQRPRSKRSRLQMYNLVRIWRPLEELLWQQPQLKAKLSIRTSWRARTMECHLESLLMASNSSCCVRCKWSKEVATKTSCTDGWTTLATIPSSTRHDPVLSICRCTRWIKWESRWRMLCWPI